jgi:cytochrome c oxidase subunit 3
MMAGIPAAQVPAKTAAAPRPSELAGHFDTLPQQLDASRLGMWIFLATELLLFGGLFCVYAVLRARSPELFTYGHRFLDVGWGAINTVVLIFSSFTMAMAVWAAQTNQRRDLVLFLSLTLLGGADFLGIKVVEYAHKFHDNLVWGAAFYRSAERETARPLEVREADAPAVEARISESASAPPSRNAGDPVKGRELFRNSCAACHGLRGEGIPGQGKDMRHSEFIRKLDDAGLLAFIQRGRLPNDALNTTGRLMPARGGNPFLTDANLLDIIAYVREVQESPATGDSAAEAGRDASAQAAATSSVEPARPAAVFLEKSVLPPPAPAPVGLRPVLEREAGSAAEGPPPDPRRDPQCPPNMHIFFGLYFCMTGLHGLHVLAGLVLISWLLMRSLRGDFSSAYFTPVDLGGLYWHLVDVIWIFLFPLLYLSR